jgi:CheY-like chemotaxis protein
VKGIDMPRLLVIDDDAVVCRILKRTLESAGFEVLTAANGNAGLELYRRSRPEVVVTDVIMPEKDGIETLAEIRRENPDAKVIAISGSNDTGLDFLRVMRQLGADCALEKPVSAHALLAAVNDCLPREKRREQIS